MRKRKKKKLQESKGHKKLKNNIYNLLKNCGFLVDKEVHFNLSGSKENGKYVDEFSVDVVAKFYDGKNYLLFFECKDRKKLRQPQREFRERNAFVKELLEKRNNIKILFSEAKKLKQKHFKDIDEVRYCFVFTQKIDPDLLSKYKKIGSKFGISIWSNLDVRYFQEMSNVLMKWEKYEILRELNLPFQSVELYSIPAIKIKQNGYPEMYLTGIPPAILLRIGYVYRRASGKPLAYQRILNKDRITKIRNFIKKEKPLFPNVIILAFDNDPEIQKNIKYEEGKLSFPIKYCSAWIIDGQHRLYGFSETKYEKWKEIVKLEKFKLPVIIFKNINEKLQCQTFININYYQKKINPTLLCDLSTVVKNLKFELTWVSLLGQELNKRGPLQGIIKISEFDRGKPISLSSFVRYGLLETLLGYNKKKKEYSGPLYTYAPFDPKKKFENKENQKAFKKQRDLLIRFFDAVKANTKKEDKKLDPWRNFKDFALLKVTGINALFLVLNKIMAKYPSVDIDLKEYLEPLSQIDFSREQVASYGGGWKGFRNFANEMIKKLNESNNDNLTYYESGIKDESKI